ASSFRSAAFGTVSTVRNARSSRSHGVSPATFGGGFLLAGIFSLRCLGKFLSKNGHKAPGIEHDLLRTLRTEFTTCQESFVGDMTPLVSQARLDSFYEWWQAPKELPIFLLHRCQLIIFCPVAHAPYLFSGR